MAVGPFLSVLCLHVLTLLAAVPSSSAINVDKKGASLTFNGIGGLSGGGATSRLLVDYKEPQRSQVLDYLFKPNFGASLQILKVEIGGDSQSTDGTETSHMHSADDLNYHRGYEWWLMVEAKKRNPDIKLYGLAWAYPGWVGNGSGSPFQYPSLTASYIVKWVEGAKTVYDLDIDYVGIWNERPCSGEYVITLRSALDKAGFSKTLIVAQDGGSQICQSLASNETYKDAVGIIGLHYPSDFSDYSVCHSLGKPFWASEESSSYDDANGAACWARVINSHWVLSQMTGSIMWNLVGSYYHGTKWYASSMLTAVQPWSGHYWVAPVVWATAHVTQFTKVGWKYLKNGAGSGELPQGGYYVTWVDPNGSDFTIVIVKISREHAPCTRPGLPDFNTTAEEISITLDSSMESVEALNVWYSNFENGPPYPQFEKQEAVKIVNHTFKLSVPVGGYFTLTTLTDGNKGNYSDVPHSSASFPLPYQDNFDEVEEYQEGRYFSDQIGAFEVHPAKVDAAHHKGVMTQMVPATPIGWTDHGSRGPVTVIGMLEWQDLTVQVDFLLPEGTPLSAAGCIAQRSEQMWGSGIVLCVNGTGHFNLSNNGPSLISRVDRPETEILHSGHVGEFDASNWHHLSLTMVDDMATGFFDSQVLFSNEQIKNFDNGFAALGTNGWFPVQFDNFRVDKAGSNWNPKPACAAAKEGDVLTARNCTINGLTTDDQIFELVPSFQLRHVPSGLCATAKSIAESSEVTLEPCSSTSANQVFLNDYTHIRNRASPLQLGKYNLAGSLDTREISLQSHSSGHWTSWVYFPNTQQLRNQYTSGRANALCLSTCPLQ